LLERRRRAQRALTTVVATCYLLGVSTRRMEKLVETLGITRLSKSQVSVMARELDEHVADFRSRPLDARPYTFVAADALVLKVREGGLVVNVHALLAAIGAAVPGASWQRCRTHYAANLKVITPKSSWPWMRTLPYSIYDQPTPTPLSRNTTGS
jgi:transposase-like protein